jgi:hypothetical protein
VLWATSSQRLVSSLISEGYIYKKLIAMSILCQIFRHIIFKNQLILDRCPSARKDIKC